MSQVGNIGGTTQVELYAHTDEGVVIDRINQKTKQTGRCPINMPSAFSTASQSASIQIAALR